MKKQKDYIVVATQTKVVIPMEEKAKRVRGNTVEFDKSLYKRIKIAAMIEGKSVGDFSKTVLEKKVLEVENSYAQKVLGDKNNT